jgi:hypothetical protein
LSPSLTALGDPVGEVGHDVRQVVLDEAGRLDGGLEGLSEIHSRRERQE